MADISRWNPFAELNSLQKEFFGDDWTPAFRNVNNMTTDVYTRDGEIVVEAHLPNFKKDDIDLDVEGRTLTISATRHSRTEDSDKKYVVRESSSSFQRRVTLPEGVDTDAIQANLADGVLTVSIPTPDAIGGKKKIAIDEGDSKTIDSAETNDDAQ
ncbi:Hsp20/alpha crystallin family protein [Corynebacterium cystitidis]|uniref:Heat shock protein Hsp20 n=1 Tax=Corynebacterium cystitidis DSM 20524 TaxID=1121357 RepID=A0A1H9UKK3_9CORY|nr:Hsp20/alpha crystallin family protein [Corynebacterium cystitidis]WJY81003.1 Acid shock protein [Corynebacterium cystitidis DSM 20524]SES09869.1 heat shock protein Hsp20 [Corynebacterium cystitidis DSM 20524]SNV90762.1 molecular chaperone [Corynebacterium cystitidis]